MSQQQRYVTGGTRPHLAIIRPNQRQEPLPIDSGVKWKPVYDKNGKFCFKQSTSNPNLIHYVDFHRKIDQIFDLGEGGESE